MTFGGFKLSIQCFEKLWPNYEKKSFDLKNLQKLKNMKSFQSIKKNLVLLFLILKYF